MNWFLPPPPLSVSPHTPTLSGLPDLGQRFFFNVSSLSLNIADVSFCRAFQFVGALIANVLVQI